MVECLFCTKALSPNAEALEDTILLENSDFVCLPALGALVSGYVLVVSRRHLTLINELSDDETNSLATILEQITSLAPYRNGYLIFEHGLDAQKGGSACIDHFHLHIVPNVGLTPTEIESQIPFPTKKVLFPDVLSLRNYDMRPNHLLVSDGTTTVCHFSDQIPSQLVRRFLAKHVGIPNEWNWVIYPHLDRITETIDMVVRE